MNTKEINSLDTLMGGAVSERFSDELARVLENVMDPNTDARKPRKVTLTVTIKPNEKRTVADFSVEAKASLAAPMPVATSVYLGKNEKGQVVAEEVSEELPGTVNMFTGEVINPKVATFGK